MCTPKKHVVLIVTRQSITFLVFSIQIDAATTNLMIFTVEYFKLSRSITKLEMLFYGCL